MTRTEVCGRHEGSDRDEDTSEPVGLPDDEPGNDEPRIHNAGSQYDHDHDGRSDDDLGGQRIGHGAAVGPVRRHQLDGADHLPIDGDAEGGAC
ncbi:uncharacterized protein ColSpa_03770 [Colletotrichum spaethianum]|uniref:Uncharacterized protein n=1 Tax=Colletotrichum spaethianum TaxID=700344 RepID=A0AA37LBM7_9PEZI|nr:uncharacterized protein ColSpa_03770 [Colletotrichum spaethianum]GKT43589.1 hypothetical protein ColSpa_03770 [Colletotrichum spaethianum]